MVGLSSHNTVLLPNGRRLGYAQYGHDDGFPILFFHGVPASRLSGLLPGVHGAPRGARVIAIDRPGYGLSHPQPRRRIIDWPEDVRVLADLLGLDRFAVLGHSGGGPYAAACASVLGERVTRAAIVSGMGPVTTAEAAEHLTAGEKLFRLMAAHARPALALTLSRAAERAVSDADVYLTGSGGRAAGVDAEVLSRPTIRAMMREDRLEAYAQGPDAMIDDIRLLARGWGFQLGDIRVPVDVWHGELDTVVPAWLGLQVAAAIPRARAHIVRDAGHLMIIDHIDDVLDALIDGESFHPPYGPVKAHTHRRRFSRAARGPSLAR